MSLYFYYNIKQKHFRKLIIILIYPFVIFSIYDYLITSHSDFSYIPLVGECFIFLIYILFLFYEKVQIYTPIPIYLTRVFWIAVAFAIYCAGNFFLFLYSNNVTKNAEFLYYYTLIYSTFTIFKNILLSIGIILKQPDMNINDSGTLTHDIIFDDFNIPQSN